MLKPYFTKVSKAGGDWIWVDSPLYREMLQVSVVSPRGSAPGRRWGDKRK